MSDVSSAHGFMEIWGHHPFSLLTDLYQLTQGQVYFDQGLHEREAVFHHFYRKAPANGMYAISTGLGHLIELFQNYVFDGEAIDYLRSLVGSSGRQLFSPEYLEYLRSMRFACNIEAMPEGTLSFPFEPDLKVEGPLIQAQLLETIICTIMNHQTLIATKAARLRHSIGPVDPLLEFGLRRAQGLDGGLSASRAAYIGGADATSNVFAARMYGIPLKGTHAHSMVGVFGGDRPAFRAFSESYPDDSIFLVDTFDTIRGVVAAIDVAQVMRVNGYELKGIRLDSGDLAYLSKRARAMFDRAGFPEVAISASNDLDEEIIHSMKMEGAEITIYGVGTKLSTGGQPALGGVYKLAAIEDDQGEMKWVIKLSQQPIKTSIPGSQNVRRFTNGGGMILGDMIYSHKIGIPNDSHMVNPKDPTQRLRFLADAESTDLLKRIFTRGVLVHKPPTLGEVKQRVIEQMASLEDGSKRIHNPHSPRVGIESNLFGIRQEMIEELRPGGFLEEVRN